MEIKRKKVGGEMKILILNITNLSLRCSLIFLNIIKT